MKKKIKMHSLTIKEKLLRHNLITKLYTVLYSRNMTNRNIYYAVSSGSLTKSDISYLKARLDNVIYKHCDNTGVKPSFFFNDLDTHCSGKWI